MAAIPGFEPVLTAKGWMISIPPAMNADGRRRRKYFSGETEARKYGAKLRGAHGSGVRGVMIPAKVALEAGQALKLLEGTGISLLEAARMARQLLQGDAAKETFAARHARATAANEALWSPRYAADMRRCVKWVTKWFLKLPCGAIDEAQMDRALREGRTLALATLEMRRARIKAVLGYKERHRRTAEVSILTVKQVARLLRVCASKEERWTVALLVFAGIRPDAEQGEIRRLHWEAVGEKEIYVSGGVAKTGTDRHVPITPRLNRLLRGHPKTGRVAPAQWKRAWQRLRKEAEIAELQDVCRHTFASHYLAAYGEEEAKQAMGHTARSETIFRFYRRAVTRDAGRKFFGMLDKENNSDREGE